MHIPDGFLSPPVIGATAVISVTGIGLSYLEQFHVKRSFAGLIAAFVFVGQMVNYPVITGASGHLMGSAMTAILLGPMMATFVLTGVLVTQCLFLHDGGFTALGANILNMAIIGVWSGWIAYHLMGGNKRPKLAAAIAGWVSIMLAALLCSIELITSGFASANAVLSSMMSVHALIGLGEAAITGLIIYILQDRSIDAPSSHFSLWPRGAMVLIMSIGCLLLAPIACKWPDGLTWALNGLK